MITLTRKIGKNKGQSRVWLEGKYLAAHGWTKGTTYERDTSIGNIVLTKSTLGKLKVAGGVDRPVIDLAGKWVTELFEGHEQVGVIVSDEMITIAPIFKTEEGEA